MAVGARRGGGCPWGRRVGCGGPVQSDQQPATDRRGRHHFHVFPGDSIHTGRGNEQGRGGLWRVWEGATVLLDEVVREGATLLRASHRVTRIGSIPTSTPTCFSATSFVSWLSVSSWFYLWLCHHFPWWCRFSAFGIWRKNFTKKKKKNFFFHFLFFSLVFQCRFIGPSDRTRALATTSRTTFEENRIPTAFLVILIVQFILMILERALYLRKNLRGKLIFQLLLVLTVHGVFFFYLPKETGRYIIFFTSPIGIFEYYSIKFFFQDFFWNFF